MDARDLLAWNVRRLRTGRGLSQERLAVDAAIDRTYISKLERSVHAATIDVMEQIAAALDVPIAELLAVPPPGAALPANLTSGRHNQ